MIFLVDHHLEGQAILIEKKIAAEGWLEIIPISLVTLEEVGIPVNSNDRIVWRFAQENQMILLTGNRKMKGEDSLEQVLRE